MVTLTIIQRVTEQVHAVRSERTPYLLGRYFSRYGTAVPGRILVQGASILPAASQSLTEVACRPWIISGKTTTV